MIVKGGALQLSITIDKDDFASLRDKLGRFVSRVPARINDDFHEIANSIRNRMREVIAEKTKGFGTLGNSLQLVNTANSKEKIQWKIFIADGRARIYGPLLEEGLFRPRIVKISNKPDLKAWIEKNLSNANKIIKRDTIMVGTTWTGGHGVKFAETAVSEHFGIPMERVRKRVQETLFR